MPNKFSPTYLPFHLLRLVALLAAAGTTPSQAAEADGNVAPPSPAPPSGLVAGEHVEVLCTISQDERQGRVRVLNASSMSDDGGRLLLRLDQPAAGRDLLAVYDTRTGRELLRRAGARPQTIVLIGDSISPDGLLVAYHETNARFETDVVLVEVASRRDVFRARRKASVTARFLGGQDRLLLCEAGDRAGSIALTLLDAATGRPTKEVETDRVRVALASASVDGPSLVCSRNSGEGPDPMCVYDLGSDAVVCVLEECVSPYPAPAFVKGRGEVAGLEKGTLVKWDARTGRRTKRADVLGGREPAGPVVFSPDGQLLFAAVGQAVHVVDSVKELTVAEIRAGGPIELVAAGNDGTFAVQLVAERAVQVARLKRGIN